MYRIVAIFKQEEPNYKKKELHGPSFLQFMTQWLEHKGQLFNLTQSVSAVASSTTLARSYEFDSLN